MRTPTLTLALILALAAPAMILAAPALARDPMPHILPVGFVYLRDVEPGIVQDMRYARSDNFTGRPLPGYDAGECVLRREVAVALARVQTDLAKSNLSLKVYDCYRPTRASRAMARWANDGKDDGARDIATKRFYPALDKRTLFAQGYIAALSAHASGSAIDLTLVPLPATPPAPFDAGVRYGACTAEAAQRSPDSSLDMGTGFDCFDPKSHTASSAIAPEAKRARARLLAAMRAHGFKNYFREWWHFTYGARPAQHYDFPIAPR